MHRQDPSSFKDCELWNMWDAVQRRLRKGKGAKSDECCGHHFLAALVVRLLFSSLFHCHLFCCFLSIRTLLALCSYDFLSRT